MVEFNNEKDEFLIQHKGFSLIDTIACPNGGSSKFYANSKDMVIIDNNICEGKKDEPIFSYTLITDKQNTYMNIYDRVFRFLGYKQEEVDYYLFKNDEDVQFSSTNNVADRNDMVEESILEYHFVDSFSNTYGNDASKYLNREYSICDEDGKNYFLDYFVRTKGKKIAVEENGVTYHHPQIIKEEKYRNQLNKQNTCTLWGIKLYRFSSEDCNYENRIEDDIRRYFGNDTSDFIESDIKADRKVELYEHQSISLEEIKRRREAGIKAFLVVLPTASGKSKIVEEDIKEFAKSHPEFKALVLAPGVETVNDWIERIGNSLNDYSQNIEVATYMHMARHYSEYDKNAFNYFVVDEAHHAVAPVLKRVIQYFDVDFLIGLTATDQRPDKKKLETVFGSYSTSLSLKEAMEKGIVAKANVYRIETNIDLSNVRFNGKDYVNADLEKSIRVTSRNQLIVDVLKEYFSNGIEGDRQGVIFCVNINHANEMAKLLNKAGITAVSYTGQTKKPNEVMRKFKDKEIRFLCTCNMISEGWDYPELGILVMARPTISKVLYLQQIGRGLRKTDTKKNVFIIDVVDEYGAMAKACNMHTIFNNPYYVQFGDITKADYKVGDFVIIDGIKERIEKISEIDIESFDDKYGDYLSQEQVAREYYVSTSTITSWIKKGKMFPSFKYMFGSKPIYLFSPEDVAKYKNELNIKDHNDSTIKDDFFEFLNERDYSLSYKMPFFLAFMKHVNDVGEADIDDVLNDYIAFYKDRIDRNLPVDRSSCPYNDNTLEDKVLIKTNMLTNPFEKFERKRFLYYSKNLSVLSMNHALFEKLNKDDWRNIKNQLEEDLKNYYGNLGGL